MNTMADGIHSAAVIWTGGGRGVFGGAPGTPTAPLSFPFHPLKTRTDP